MVVLADRSTGKYAYYCDRCGRKVSYEDGTLRQIHIKYSPRNSNKLCELCDKCCEALRRGVFKRKVNKNG